MIQGPVQVVGHLGNTFGVPAAKDNVALCRCGQSGNKPFCEGSHRRSGFQAAALARPPEIKQS